ncbi:hypothetical protein RUM43_011875 [Polyplax serrata]|uniref:Cell growth-regulating nucleolar protein n=1 Tax=Polyplax serrata TaxID=468196 RepID=A0AAN8PTZ7_POLSC
MVFFTCSNCGDSVKKPAVAKHLQTKCRIRDLALTCMDCLKEFRGNEYEAHTKCLSEKERYSAKGNSAQRAQDKGEKKQKTWHECMQMVLKKPTLKPDERDLIRSISKYDNVPRKKAKFVNFLTHAFKQYTNRTELIERVWNEIELVFKEVSTSINEANKQLQKQAKPEPKQPKPDPSATSKQVKAETKQSKQDTNKPAKQEGKQTKQESKQSKADQKSQKGEAKTQKQSKEPKQQQQQQQQQQQKQSKGDGKQQKQDPKNAAKGTAKTDEGSAKDKKRKRTAEEPVEVNADAGKTDKQKKKKQKSTDEKKVDKVEGNDDDVDMFDACDEPTTEKINRKRKADELSQTESNNSVADQGESGMKKKKKKNEKSSESQVTGSEAPKSEESAKSKKKSKATGGGGGGSGGSGNTESKGASEKQKSGGGDANAVKKEKKPKKSENKENISDKQGGGGSEKPAKAAVKTKVDQQGEGEKAAPKPKKVKTESAAAPQGKTEGADHFDWKATILQVLNQDGKNNRIQLQKLQKKVLQLHCQVLNCENSDKKKSKFMKKLKEMQEVTMDKDFVVLKS